MSLDAVVVGLHIFVSSASSLFTENSESRWQRPRWTVRLWGVCSLPQRPWKEAPSGLQESGQEKWWYRIFFTSSMFVVAVFLILMWVPISAKHLFASAKSSISTIRPYWLLVREIRKTSISHSFSMRPNCLLHQTSLFLFFSIWIA